MTALEQFHSGRVLIETKISRYSGTTAVVRAICPLPQLPETDGYAAVLRDWNFL
jgi:hypothetical protein